MDRLEVIAGGCVRAVPARAEDARALQAVMDAASDYFELTEGEPAAPGSGAALIAEAEADSERRVYLLWPVGPTPVRPVGFLDLHLHQPEPGVAHVGVLALRPEARGRGLGGELVEALCAALQAEGFGALRASVGDENPGARAFWERVGFGEVGRLEGGVGRLEGGVTVLERATG